MKSALEELQKVSPDLKSVGIVTEPRGYNGRLVHLCFSTGTCADFAVDRATDISEHDMDTLTKKAILMQLRHHEANKE